MSLPALVPIPRSVTVLDAAPFVLAGPVRISGDTRAASVLGELITARTGIGAGHADHGDGAVRLDLVRGSDDEHHPAAQSYRLRVDADRVAVQAPDAAGLFYAAQTLGQLLTADGEDWVIPAVEIDDAPRFAYRGVMLDVARHFFAAETVFGVIDRAAALKLNHLHLHLSDDQGWRLEMRSRPELTATASATSVGADPGGFYRRSDYSAIVAYAAARHMCVVPEVDVPGHTHAVGLAYPELAAAPVITDEIRETVATYGGDLPAPGEAYTGIAVGFSSLRIDDEATYDFLADVFGELAGMTPGPYLHIGGDEALGTAPEDYAEFIARVTEMIADIGKTPIAWHEAGAAAGLHPDTVGQYWGFVTPTDGMDDRARTFVRDGAGLILSPADAVYLDMKPDADAPLGLTWANGPTSLRRAYEWEPSEVISGIGEDDILGVEAPLWTETIRTAADIDDMAFPRIAAAAEAAWSPRSGTPGRDWESFRERVSGLAPLWTSLGIGFGALPSASEPDADA